MKRLWIPLFVIVLLVPIVPAQAQQQPMKTIYNTPFPSSIRVAIRENNWSGEPDPRGRIIYVKTVPFDTYCRNVLPNEWMPSWKDEALEAGAMAVKMFAWYHVLHPITLDGYTFHVDNTTNFQAFRELTDQPKTNAAYWVTRNLTYVRPNGEIIELNYRAGYPNDPNWQYRNAQIMAQWGSEYWAERGRNMIRILEFYYQGRALRSLPRR
jgi:peptidoglycan hydrolase-like amidase